MNVLHLISSGGFFGAENVIAALTFELNKDKSHNIMVGVFLNSQSPNMEIADVCQNMGICTTVFPCDGKIDIKTIIILRAFIKRHRINIIHTHGYKSNIYCFFSSLKLPVFRVTTCHNWQGSGIRWRLYAILDRFFLKYFDRVVAVSEEVKHIILDSNISPKKVSIIRNGIIYQRFNGKKSSKKLRAQWEIKEKGVVIGSIGRISEEKGHRFLLEISKKIFKKYPEVVFLIIGSGPLLDTYKKEYISDSIIFAGKRTDVEELYKCMDIFVLSSLKEGLPMAVLEAMASRLPVVATRVGEIPNVIIDGETGIIIEPGDKKGLRDSLSYLLENRDIALQMGKKGCERVKKEFSSEKMAKEYMKVYQKLLSKDSKD